MKKIFAITLALVMVLSMASAFAFVGTCGDYAYTCPTVGCGVAKAEVVQFVANNTVDKYEESTCAGVVAGQKVFYGVKVTFDADVNQQWYAHANTKLKVETANITGATASGDLGKLQTLTGKNNASDVSKKVFWLKKVGTTYSLTTAFDPATCVFEGVADNTRAEVCANVEYNFDGTYGTGDTQMNAAINYGSFKVTVTQPGSKVDYKINVVKGGDQIDVYVIGGVVKYVTVNGGTVFYYDNAYNGLDGTLTNGEVSGKKTSTTAGCSVIDELMALIKLDFGYCVNADVVKNIFGWVNGDPDCATWNADAKAIVNAECEVQAVAIPKTGDKSVLAWLF